MKLSEEDTSKVMMKDLPERSEYYYIIHAAQDVGKYLTSDYQKSSEPNKIAWQGITDLMARCIARGMRLANEKKED